MTRTRGPAGTPAGRADESPWRRAGEQRAALRSSKHESVVRAAAIAFATHGIDGTSMESLAASLGVTKPTIYRAVGDKDELLRSCERRMVAAYREALAQARTAAGSGLDRCFHYLRASLRLSVEDDFGRLLLTLASDMYSSSLRETAAMREEVEEQFRRWIRQDIAAGRLAAWIDPRIAVLALFATFNFVPRWFRPDGPLTLDEVFDANRRLFVDGWLAAASGRAAPARRPTGRRAG